MFTISSTGLYARMGTSAHGLSHPFNPKTFANALGGIRNALEKSLHFQLEMNTSKGLRSGERGGHVPRDFFFFFVSVCKHLPEVCPNTSDTPLHIYW